MQLSRNRRNDNFNFITKFITNVCKDVNNGKNSESNSTYFCCYFVKIMQELAMKPAIDKPEGTKALILGPCSAESEAQMIALAEEIKEIRPDFVRAGLWKPRTRPGSFEGMGSEALKWMNLLQTEFGLKVCTEVGNTNHVDMALKAGIDAIWLGARTTVNPFYVDEIARALKGVDIPVMVKNPMNPDIYLWIGGIERIMQAGISKIAAIHRGSLNSRVTFSVSTAFSASIKKAGLKPMASGSSSYSSGTVMRASPCSGARLVSSSSPFAKPILTPRDSCVVSSAARRMARCSSAVSTSTRLSLSFGITSSNFGKCPSTSTELSVALPARAITWFGAIFTCTSSSVSPTMRCRVIMAFSGTIASFGPSAPDALMVHTASRRPSVATSRRCLSTFFHRIPLMANRVFSFAAA